MPRWGLWALLGLTLSILLIGPLLSGAGDPDKIAYSDFMAQVRDGKVESVEIDNTNGSITGELDRRRRVPHHRPARRRHPRRRPRGAPRRRASRSTTRRRSPSFLVSLLPFLIPVAIFVAFFWFMQRRAQSQMGGIMSIGRSKAKTYSTERPGTTFADVAGYDGVKQDIKEVVDFLKTPDRFAEIGARIPKGVLLVGPPGTGKTLIARAVAGEAGVPFLSVTGSDFMEMFVGVGASRVRDLFQSARKMGKAIIFVDEIDSIGRKRGAGLGGGHDEREQTLNQMLSEMDGFEATEGIVMIAATNRPDILDPALLRPGRFDRQVVVPLPELSEREAILRVHAKSKRLAARRRPRGGRPRHARHVRRRPRQPRQRGRALRGASRRGRDLPAALRDGPRPRAHGRAPRVDGPRRPREGGHRLPRGRPRRGGRGAPPGRPGPQGHDPARWAWRSASRSSSRWTTATSTGRTTSRTASSSAWAAASPRTSCSA